VGTGKDISMATKKAAPTTKVAKKPTKEAKPKKSAKVNVPRRVTKKDLKEPQARRRIRHPRVVVGFVDFLREQSVVGLAIGLVIGSQVKALADQLIASFINPLIGLILPGTGALDKKVFVVHLAEKSAVFAWGSFVAVLLSFMTTATVIYFVFKSLKLDKLTKKKDDKK